MLLFILQGFGFLLGDIDAIPAQRVVRDLTCFLE